MCYSPICKKCPGNKKQCSLVIPHMPHTFVPIAATSNLWIIPSNPQVLGSIMTIICPDKATSTVHLQQPFHILRLSPACSTTPRYFHLPPHFEDDYMVMNVSLDTANINGLSILTLDFRIWQHFSRNSNQPHLQKWANIPKVPVTQLYRDMINNSEPIHSFTIKDDEDPSLIWTILKHPGTYIGTISLILVLCIGVYCFKFQIRPASPRCWPYSPVSLWHAIVPKVLKAFFNYYQFHAMANMPDEIVLARMMTALNL